MAQNSLPQKLKQHLSPLPFFPSGAITVSNLMAVCSILRLSYLYCIFKSILSKEFSFPHFLEKYRVQKYQCLRRLRLNSLAFFVDAQKNILHFFFEDLP